MNLLRWLVFSNCLISLSAGFLAFGTSRVLASQFQPIFFGLFVFASTLFTYNFQRLIKLAFRDNKVLSSRNFWIGTHQLQLKILSLIGLILAIYIYFYHLFQYRSFFLLLPLVLISILYAVRFFKSKNLRELPYIKIHLIALVWMCATVFLPSLNGNSSILFVVLLGLALYLYIIAITIPFDIRDLRYDEDNQKTIPQVFGVSSAKKIAICLALTSFSLFLFLISTHWISTVLLCIAFGVQITLIIYSNLKRDELYFSGAIDGAITLLGLTLMV